MQLRNEKGIALVFTLFLLVAFVSFSGLLVLRTIHERNLTQVDQESAKAFYAAYGGAHAGLETLDTLINNYLLTTIANATPTGVISDATAKVAAGDGLGWLLYAVRNAGTPVLAQDGIRAEYGQIGSMGDYPYAYDIIITENGNPSAANPEAWDFPFTFRVESSATQGRVTKLVLVTGNFTVRVRKDNFAKYALFTNSQTTPGGTNVWFTDKTNFAGPLHTNGRFNFAFNPGGTFEDVVSQQDQFARYYNNGWTVLLDDDHNGTKDVPVFHDAYTRNTDAITLAAATDQAEMESEVMGGQTFGSDGVYVPNDGTTLTGGIYVQGDGDVELSLDAGNNAVYTVTQGAVTKTITVDRASNQTTVVDVGTGAVGTYQGIPDGVDHVGTIIYVSGNIGALQGTVQRDTELTVASGVDMVISDNLVYQDYTPAVGSPGVAGYVPPNADGTTNVLGLVSWGGDVLIGTSAPDDVNVHGTILSQNGIFQVDQYNDTVVGPRGTATLLGGVITDNYGAFGLFNGSTGVQLSGYGRNFVYDQRMSGGTTPPYFPSLDAFVAFTNDIADKLVWQEGVD